MIEWQTPAEPNINIIIKWDILKQPTCVDDTKITNGFEILDSTDLTEWTGYDFYPDQMYNVSAEACNGDLCGNLSHTTVQMKGKY